MRTVIRIGSRDSRLGQVQVAEALALFQSLLPSIAFDKVWFSSPGDRDQDVNLETAPVDFFTRDLDDALRAEGIDCALHSAKDYPYPASDDIDFFWLPCGHDQRDVYIGSENPKTVGVSSERRREYVQRTFPDAVASPLRGTIDRRLAQLDAGIFDGMVIAGVALQRLGLLDRIRYWIPTHELVTPEGQGHLLLSFRKGDIRMQRLRTLLVTPVVLASAGTSADTCTVETMHALRRCDVCFYDALLDARLLSYLPGHAKKVYVGKRCGNHSRSQQDICALLTQYARMGKRVVRLKGGDAGMYGRLAEEVDAVSQLDLPYRVFPGVSSLFSATTGTGLLLTRRNVADRIHVLSGHSEASHKPDGDAKTEAIFMGTRCLDEIVSERLQVGYASSTPIAVVWNAGLPDEKVVCGTLENIRVAVSRVEVDGAPGLILLGAAMDGRNRYHAHGALRGMRVWVTSSVDVQKRACDAVWDHGGKPVSRPLIRLVTEKVDVDWSSYDWVVVTSPSAVRALLEQDMDLRQLPKILSCGPGTSAALLRFGIRPDAQPMGAYSTEGVLNEAARMIEREARILRVRSDRAGGGLTEMLHSIGHKADDLVICRNEARSVVLPEFDAVLFASASAVDSFLDQFDASVLQDKLVGIMGYKEIERLTAVGVCGLRVPARFTFSGAVATMAGTVVEKEIVGE